MTDEARYRLLRCLEDHPHASQREIARHLGVSVGKVNYCLRALIEKGLLKIRNFQRSTKKVSYVYVLTPKGIEEKLDITYRFLKRKIEEYDALASEIERVRRELEQNARNRSRPE
jgi:EPS-associated MarR family transcriptional regulator